MEQAAAARAHRPACGRARLTRPCAPLGRGEANLVAAAAAAYNMEDFILNVWFELHKNFMGMSVSTAARSPRSARPVPSVTCATCARAGCTTNTSSRTT